MTSPVVSIITPTYNQAEYLSRCIDSVRAQTFPGWEQIIVDDGSTDGTSELVCEYNDPRIQYIRLPHRGLSALAESYNSALAAARGDIVAILEGDDRWPPDKLEAGLGPFSDPRVLLVWGRATLIDESDRVIGERTSLRGTSKSRMFDNREVFEWLTRRNVLTPTITVMLRRDALARAGGFTQGGSSLYVDLPTWLRVMATSEGCVCFLDHVLGMYRVHATQTTQRYGRTMTADHLSVVMQLEAELGTGALESVGWNAEMRNAAIVAGCIAAGMAELRDQQFTAGRACFADAWAQASNSRERAKAALGLLSSFAHFDFFGATLRARDTMLDVFDGRARTTA